VETVSERLELLGKVDTPEKVKDKDNPNRIFYSGTANGKKVYQTYLDIVEEEITNMKALSSQDDIVRMNDIREVLERHGAVHIDELRNFWLSDFQIKGIDPETKLKIAAFRLMNP
jgi:hypothetical protein